MSKSRSTIKFGTDGWRAIIGDGFTLNNLERVARATGEWLLDEYGSSASVVIGYDTRFRGRDFAEHTAVVLASMGIRVVCGDEFAPTPAISWATTHFGHCAGIVITASHNPPEYNGFKIKGHFGGICIT
jgi:phosphomannomutase